MNIEELKDKCKDAIAHPFLGEIDAKIQLRLKGTWGAKNTKRLFPKGPIGEIIADAYPSGIIVVFKAAEVLAAIENIEKQYEQNNKSLS